MTELSERTKQGIRELRIAQMYAHQIAHYPKPELSRVRHAQEYWENTAYDKDWKYYLLGKGHDSWDTFTDTVRMRVWTLVDIGWWPYSGEYVRCDITEFPHVTKETWEWRFRRLHEWYNRVMRCAQ